MRGKLGVMNPTTLEDRECYFKSHHTLQSLLRAYTEIRSRTQLLCAPLKPEDCVVQSMEDASPTKWHLAHTTWFFETFVLAAHRSDYQSLYPHYSYLFNSYYAQLGNRYLRTNRGFMTRPTLEDVYGFRRYVDEQMRALMEASSQEELRSLMPNIEIGLHHEQQHQELILTDIKNVFSFSPLYPVYRPEQIRPRAEVRTLDWVSFGENTYEIGHRGRGFCFDNERPRHRQFLESFQLADRLVTNAEYIEFIDDGGYEQELVWLSDGWRIRQEQQWQAPLYWVKVKNEWNYFTLQGGLRKVHPSEPVCHVSYYEADAFARCVGARLPSEGEWEVAASELAVEGNFLEQECYHPFALDASARQRSPFQIFGDVWEWTCSPYVGYPRYRPAGGALGEYNAKFMANQMILRGGSCVSPQSHLRASYRNFFHPSARWQFSGLRLAKDGA